MRTRSRYEENVAFHVVICITLINSNNQSVMVTTRYDFWLQPNNKEWRCIKEVITDRQVIAYANIVRID